MINRFFKLVLFLLLSCEYSKNYKINKRLNSAKNDLKKYEKNISIEDSNKLNELLNFKSLLVKKNDNEFPFKKIPLSAVNRNPRIYMFYMKFKNLIENNAFLKEREKIVNLIWDLKFKKIQEDNVNINFN